MTRLRIFWTSVFDIRPGEYVRTAAMTGYLLCVLFAYYILKPVSRAIFLNRFEIDKLPWLYVLIAAVGGLLAYFYTKLAVNSSLRRAVEFATVFSVGVLGLFWWLIALNIGWIVYAFNIWVSLFSIILVSQGWLIAANIFNTREAKRIYGILGVGSVIGAAFGGSFTAFMVRYIGTTNLILACAGMVALSYVPFLVIVSTRREVLSGARAADTKEDFSFVEIVANLRRHRHLQVIMAIMVITFVIDVMVEFQFNAMAKIAYHDKNDLTAFLGNFYGFWLNIVTFCFQFFLTSFIVSRFGVGGTLQIMPVSIALASVATVLSPSVLSTAAARLTEASTRYSFNKTGMELLYLPLPLELRNRTKAFVDIFVDRLSRGLGGMILVFFTTVIILTPRGIAVVVMVFSLAWILLSVYAKHEYIRTVRKRLELRRLDLESARISLEEPATIQLLEQTAANASGRQAAYALSLLATAPGYPIAQQLSKLVNSPSAEVRAKAYDIAIDTGSPTLLDAAFSEIRSARENDNSPSLRSAARCAFRFADNPAQIGPLLLDHPNAAVNEGAIEYLASKPEQAREAITRDWLIKAAASSKASRRRVAAIAIRARGDEGVDVLHALIEDSDTSVVTAACMSAAALQNREYVSAVVRRLSDARVRGAAIDALTIYGNKIIGTLSDLIEDGSVPLPIRLHIPRVLRKVPTQRSVDVLLNLISDPNLTLRASALRALNRLREDTPNLDYGKKSVTDQILSEARYYFEMNAALSPFAELKKPHTPAGLLASTLEERLSGTLERLFRLLGLRYPLKQIYAAYLAVNRGQRDDHAAALEFLDNMLDSELKRVVVPILDDPGRAEQRGRDLFGIEPKDPATAIRELMDSGDEWLVACAMATAAQLQLRQLASDISRVSASGDGEVSQVARDAIAVLA